MTLRDILNESSVSKELISAGTGKEIARTGFEKHSHYPEDYEIQMVRTVDGTYDVYFRAPGGPASNEPRVISNEPYRHKECYIGSIKKGVNSFQAWHDARVMCYRCDKVPKEYKQFIKKNVNNKLNMDRWDKDVNYKEIED